jgi:putative SOS response-associated peptidase YedK
MCGRFTLRRPAKVNIEGLSPTDLFASAPRYNIAPSQDVLVVTEIAEKRTASLFRWGLIPSWSKDGAGFINARAETLAQRSNFREAFERRRCLIPADGFYEWKKSGKFKQPYFFQMQDESPFAFAGIWDRWRRGDNVITSCAIITTTPNTLLESIHDRMPAILHDEDQNSWLRSKARPEELKALLAPFPASEMKRFPVSLEVNSALIDEARLVEQTAESLPVSGLLFDL